MPRTEMVMERVKDEVRRQEKEFGEFPKLKAGTEAILRSAELTQEFRARCEGEEMIEAAYATAAKAIRFIQQYG